MQHSRQFLLDSYRSMATIRRFEDRVHDEFAGGKIPGFVHLYAGEEASAVGVCSQLGARDVIASTHRGHGHCIAKGCDVDGHDEGNLSDGATVCAAARADRCTSPTSRRG